MADPAPVGERIFKGIPVSSGVCHGKIVVLTKAEASVPKYQVPDNDLPQQVQRLEQALITTRQQILEVQRQVNKALGADDARIFDAHLLVLEDPTLIDSVTNLIHTKKINVEWAFHDFTEKY